MNGTDARTFASTRGRLESWRKAHGGRGVRIPEELWSDAVELSRVHGASKTAQVLGVDRERLQARVSASGGRERAEAGLDPVFVELGMGALGGGRTVVEFVSREGDRMRIDVTGPNGLDVVQLSEAFWRGRP